MANELRTLFQDIADAIKDKTGSTDTMKPAEFPAKIAAIPVGSGGATSTMIGKSGSIDGSTLSDRTNVTITHNCGKVPDFIIVYVNKAPVSGEMYMAYGFTQKIASRVPSNMNAGVAIKAFSGGASPYPTTQGFENENVSSMFGSGYGHIRAVNETTFTIGGVNNPLSAAEYMWVAYCGMV